MKRSLSTNEIRTLILEICNTEPVKV